MEETHHDDHTARGLWISMSKGITAEQKAEIRASPVYCGGIDESTDRGVNENLVVYLSWMHKGKAKIKFLELVNLKHGTGSESVCDALQKCLAQFDPNYEKKLVGFASDGASAMTGHLSGVAVRLRQGTKHLLNFHCICHRLALGANDASSRVPLCGDVETVLRATSGLFSVSAKRLEAWESIIERYGESGGSRVHKLHNIRWLARAGSLASVVSHVDSLMDFIQELGGTDFDIHHRDNESTQTTTKVAALAQNWRDFEILAALHFCADIFGVLGDISASFQKEYLDITFATDTINDAKRANRVNYIGHGDSGDQMVWGEHTRKFLTRIKGEGEAKKITLGKHDISVSEEQLGTFYQFARQLAIAVNTSLDERFPDFEKLEAFRIFSAVDLRALEKQQREAVEAEAAAAAARATSSGLVMCTACDAPKTGKFCNDCGQLLVSSTATAPTVTMTTTAGPSRPEDAFLATYGEEQIDLLCIHYKDAITDGDSRVFDPEGAKAQWREFRTAQLWNMRHMNWRDMWEQLLADEALCSKYPDLFFLSMCGLVFMLGNASCERGFSKQNQLKGPWSTNMGECDDGYNTLDIRMRVAIHAPKLTDDTAVEFCAVASRAYWDGIKAVPARAAGAFASHAKRKENAAVNAEQAAAAKKARVDGSSNKTVEKDESARLTPRPKFGHPTFQVKASQPAAITDDLKGKMLGKLIEVVDDAGVTTCAWRIGRVTNVTPITVNAPDGQRQVNTHTVQWRETIPVTSAATGNTAQRVTGDLFDLHISIDSLGPTREWAMVEPIPLAIGPGPSRNRASTARKRKAPAAAAAPRARR